LEGGVLALIASKEVVGMAAMSIRNLDEWVLEKLRVRAARHGRSMEAEVRAILVDAVREPDEGPNMFAVLADRFAEIGGVDLDLPPRSTAPRAAEFAE
jgi:plasmid stability protein